MIVSALPSTVEAAVETVSAVEVETPLSPEASPLLPNVELDDEDITPGLLTLIASKAPVKAICRFLLWVVELSGVISTLALIGGKPLPSAAPRPKRPKPVLCGCAF